ncbi:MAG: type II toxin-antitoxin system RelE/ParE family toxin [Nanoarchaeota archaeon]
MELQIKLTVSCKKALQSLHIDIQRSLKTVIKKLARGEIKGKPLAEQLTGFSSLKDGNYRAIYRIVNGLIIVFDVGHRSTIYSKFTTNKLVE